MGEGRRCCCYVLVENCRAGLLVGEVEGGKYRWGAGFRQGGYGGSGLGHGSNGSGEKWTQMNRVGGQRGITEADVSFFSQDERHTYEKCQYEEFKKRVAKMDELRAAADYKRSN